MSATFYQPQLKKKIHLVDSGRLILIFIFTKELNFLITIMRLKAKKMMHYSL